MCELFGLSCNEKDTVTTSLFAGNDFNLVN